MRRRCRHRRLHPRLERGGEPPGRARRAATRAARRGRARDRRRLDRRDRRGGPRARRDRRLVRREPRSARRHRGRLPRGIRARVCVLRPRRRRRPAPGRRARAACSSSSAPTRATSRSGRASPTGEGYDDERYPPSAEPAVRDRAAAEGDAHPPRTPFHDPTSGMAAVNAKAMPVMAQPYVSGAPEVEALLRLQGRGPARRGGRRAHARAGERRVEAAGEEGGQARAHRDRRRSLFFRWLRHRRA